MKKILSLALVFILSLSVLVGCSSNSSDSNTLVIGVSPEPHADLVKAAADQLKEEGIDLEIIEFDDYVTPNLSLDSGEIDANFFQHKPYLDDFIAKEGLDLVSIGGVHIEPMALYSNTIDSLDDIEEGAEIAIPNDTVNGGRALILLENNGLIKLKEGVGLEATENDIVENPKNIKFTALEAAYIPRALEEVDAAVINGNYALESGLNPLKDSIIIEDGDSPYANIIAVRKGEENDEKFTKLMDALQSDEVRAFIEENYDGAIVPAF